ncbi:beta-ketoacyl-ACP reductase [candidate division KSB3 bacterium]|uniref:Beta-ketoacyl-ACP reductase n=1 Tax=candidate division KSB3 bacterium TaxID=2044937 RepID=A0A2G6KKD9_9BACT|nr:MAG: beta-ketoacyl-ACP reductase [candidate division KSB3 bacterium]
MLKNKVVIITGSGSGIGQAAAVKFANAGANVVVHAKSNVAGGENLVQAIEQLGRESIFVQGDLSNPETVKVLFDTTLNTFGTIDILINNAGVASGKAFLETTKDDWLEAFNHNFFSAVLCAQAAAKIMLKKGEGKIINTSSVRGLPHGGREGLMPYSSAKAAMINFTKTLAKDLAPNITVNAVAPGFVYTPNYDDFPQELKEAFMAATPIRRFIDVDEIADAFLYLATANSVTGEVLVVDGGFTLKLA